MVVILSNPTTTLCLSFPSICSTSSICNSHANFLIGSTSSKKLFFRSQSKGTKGFRDVSVQRHVISCGLTEINEAQFSDVVLSSDVPVLVEFVADWCGPCRLMSPAIEWVSQEYKDKLKVVKMNHDLNPRLIEEYKVYGLPTLILFKNGVEVPKSRWEGAMTKVTSTCLQNFSLADLQKIDGYVYPPIYADVFVERISVRQIEERKNKGRRLGMPTALLELVAHLMGGLGWEGHLGLFQEEDERDKFGYTAKKGQKLFGVEFLRPDAWWGEMVA